LLQGLVHRLNSKLWHEVCELLWLKVILDNLKVTSDVPMTLYYGNKSTINIAHNSIQHDRAKHMEIECHFIKEKLDSDLISEWK